MDKAKAELRVAELVLNIAVENKYKHIVITFLENAVEKAKHEVEKLEGAESPKWLSDFFEIMAPRKQVVTAYAQPHRV